MVKLKQDGKENCEVYRINPAHYEVSGFNLRKNPNFVGPWDTCQVEHSRSVQLYFETKQGSDGLTPVALTRVLIDHLEETGASPNELRLAKELLLELS